MRIAVADRAAAGSLASALARPVAAIVAALAVTVGAASCSDDASVTTTVTTEPGPSRPAAPCTAADPPLRVDTIASAVAAVEAERGGAQQYYEINATDLFVNLFVASDGGTATPYVFVGDALTGGEPVAGASGNTFAADRVDLDPRLVISCVQAQLPDSTPTAFEIVGGPDGAVRFSVVMTSQAGGHLVVEVSRDGSVVAVDPV